MLYVPDTQKENRPNHDDLSKFISKLSKKEKKEKHLPIKRSSEIN